MKKAVLLLIGIFTISLTAQEIEPKFEKEGKLVKATYFHDNGEIAQMGFYLNEKLHGEWKMYDAEGNKIAMGQYDKGVRTGKWFFWEGKELQEVAYLDNEIVNITKWKNGETVVLNK